MIAVTTLIERDAKTVWAYNARSGAILEIDREVARGLARVNDSSFSVKERLLEGGFIVDDSTDELADMRQRYEMARHSPLLSLTVCPTFACNLRCGYCYEGNNQKAHMMSDLIADRILEFASSRGRLGVSVTWYGGEPLLAKDRVVEIQRRINETTTVLGCSMVTNGTLLDPVTFDALRKEGVRRFQITLDGTEAIHDARRPFASGRGTFDTIIRNLSEVGGDDTSVSLRVNLDKENMDNYLSLLRLFSEDIRLRKYLNSLYPARVTEWPSLSCRWREACYSEEQFSNEFLHLADKVYAEFGINMVRMPTTRSMYCSATAENSVVVGPDGEIYKCWTSAGDPDSVVGYIGEGFVTNDSELSFWRSWNPFENTACVECKQLPTCIGGCPAMVRREMTHYGCPKEKYVIADILNRVHDYSK